MIDYQVIKERLRSLEDHVFYIPLTEQEVTNLEEKVGIEFPAYYRGFLLTFGFQQDLVPGLFVSAEDFVEQNEALKESLNNYLLIGDNDGEDHWVLRTEKVKSMRIFNWTEGEVEKTDINFDDLVWDAIEDFEEAQDEDALLTNAEKSWCVQFAITTDQEQDLFKALPIEVDGKWQSMGKSEAGVDEYSLAIKLNGKAMLLSRLNFNETTAPTYFIDFKEDLDSVKKKGLIKQWSTTLKDKFSEFDLVDYGILPTDFEME